MALLDSLRTDAIFGWRQLWKRKVTSAAAILSLALATGACISAFRLIDALLLRPLPVSEPGQLYALSRVGIGFDGTPSDFDGWAYPAFQQMRAAVKGKAELVAISYSERMDLTYRSDAEMEKANIQYVSGWMFGTFGLRPSLGRLLSEDDDRKPGAHPVAVISHDYWVRRFGSNPDVIGRSFHLGDGIFEITGVGPETFTGTEPGIPTDLFLPTMMHPAAIRDDSTWHRTLARVPSPDAVEPLRQQLHATSRAFEVERSKGFTGMTKAAIDRFIDQTLVLSPAAAGASGLQSAYRRSLGALAGLVVLVLLIACVNVANLMTAQAAARAREMALRVSIGAGRGRLIQLMLVESTILAGLAAGVGAAFAWWSAPFVLSRINPPDNPARLAMPLDPRVMAFGLLLTVGVVVLFGLMPALHASGVQPAAALKGGTNPHARRRTMHALIAAQVAFCFLVLFVSGLFAATFERLANRPLGFSPERVLTLFTASHRGQPTAFWDQTAEHLRTLPGVEAVSIARRPLVSGSAVNGFITVDGGPPSQVLGFFHSVSPGWLGTMKLPLIDGRDFRPGDIAPGAAIVNETFVRQFFNGRNPMGRAFGRGKASYVVVGVVRDAPYRSLREPILPVAYIPFQSVDAAGALRPEKDGTFIVRTSAEDPLAIAQMLRKEIPRIRPEFRVSNVRTQVELIEAQTVRERLLAMLALFFACVAVLLAGIGLYGVLDYSVLQRRREIGIRMAIGAEGIGIARLVTRDAFAMVLVGAAAGLGVGLATGRYLESMLYHVSSTDFAMLAPPAAVILGSAFLAALVPALRAVRIDPAVILRSE